MKILAIDPGTTECGWCTFDGTLNASGVCSNDSMLSAVMVHGADLLAIEMVSSYGMPVGKEVFETVLWIGRFKQAWRDPDDVRLVYRRDVKMHLCGSARAKDGNIRQALLDKIGLQGVKKSPGPTYGVKSHAWAALAVAVTVADSMHPPRTELEARPF